MYLMRVTTTLAVLFAIAAGAPTTAHGRDKGKSTKHHDAHGIVVSVNKKTITIEHKKAKHTYSITSATRFIKHHAKGHGPAKMSDVKAGEHVLIQHQGNVAEEVKIAHKQGGNGHK